MASLLETEKITIKRVTGGTRDKGQWQEGSSVTTPDILVNIQPVTGQELLQLPESDREKVILSIYSKTEIKNGDRITREIDGLNYQATHVKNWTAFNLSHFKGMLKLDNT